MRQSPNKSRIKRLLLQVVVLPVLLIYNSLSLEAQRVPPVVSAAWLKENNGKQGLVVLHVTTTRPDYNNGHIPGAFFLWPGNIIISTEQETTLPAPVKEVTKLLCSFGVNNDSHIILSGANGNLIQVCRIFVNLEHYGLKGRVSILDGGLEAWKASGYEVSTETPAPAKGKFKPSIYNNLVDGTFVKNSLENKSYLIIDSRPKQQYDGSAGITRTGHIPHAKSFPQADMYDPKTFRFLEVSKISEALNKLEIPGGSRPLFYCHTGNSASVNYVAALIAGYEPLIYEGSMEEWAARLDWPMEESKK
jgi:thiosulfate/3-mercaptopyruvate sulfurtransferase